MPLVVVIDDDDEMLLAYEHALAAEGFTVIVANDGRSGLQLVRSRRPDAVVLDIRMPEIDGLTVMSLIRSDPAIEKTPIVVATGLVEWQGVSLSKELGWDAIIRKPFHMKELAETLHVVIKDED
ncbi:MAG: response regulator transcription factor [Actinomycetota bacterium]|nr:response regulator [Actinomycetota bacterium]